MRIRTVLTAAVLTAAALSSVSLSPVSGVASAQPTDRDCRDFASQAAAQSALRSQSGDPERLDADHDGIACEDWFKTGQTDGPPPVPPALPAATPPAPEPAVPAAASMAPKPVVDQDPRPQVVVPPAAAPADAPVRTVPEHQVLVKPHGAPDTGDGSAGADDVAGPAALALLVGGAAAAGAVGTRRARRSH